MNMMEHLRSRKCELALYPGVGYDSECVAFPMHDFSGKRTGTVFYRPDGPKRVQNNEKGKYYTYISKGESGIFGIQSIDYTPYILLVSGVFKATALHILGHTALHVSSIKPHDLRNNLELLRRPYYAIGDNDSEGAQFVRRWGGLQSPVDVDEMSFEAIQEFVNELVR